MTSIYVKMPKFYPKIENYDKKSSFKIKNRLSLLTRLFRKRYNGHMAQEKTLEDYRKLLPKTITAQVHKAKEGGFWAKIKEFPYCYTQGENFIELIDMINDAVLTYLEIPAKFREKVGYYAPKEFVEYYEEVRKRQLRGFLGEVEKTHEKTQEITEKITEKKPLDKKLEFNEFKIPQPVA